MAIGGRKVQATIPRLLRRAETYTLLNPTVSEMEDQVYTYNELMWWLEIVHDKGYEQASDSNYGDVKESWESAKDDIVHDLKSDL